MMLPTGIFENSYENSNWFLGNSEKRKRIWALLVVSRRTLQPRLTLLGFQRCS